MAFVKASEQMRPPEDGGKEEGQKDTLQGAEHEGGRSDSLWIVINV